MAVYMIYKNFDFLIPDAPELIQTFMAAVRLFPLFSHFGIAKIVCSWPTQESDTTSLRNAFVMLQATAPQKAIEYFLNIYDSISTLDEMMQLAVIELIRKESRTTDVNAVGGSQLKAKYIKCIFELLNSGAHSVKYEAATTLTTLTQNPAAVKGRFPLSSV